MREIESFKHAQHVVKKVQRKRKFNETSEPEGKVKKAMPNSYL